MTKIEFVDVFYERHYSSMNRKTFNRYYPSLNKTEVEDLIQDGLIKFLRIAREIEGRNEELNYLAYLYKTVNCLVINHFRRNTISTTGIIDNITVSVAEEKTHFKIDKNIKTFLKDNLTELQYSYFVMHRLFEMKYNEIAATLDISVGTVKSNLHYVKMIIDKHKEKLCKYENNKEICCY